MKYYLPILMLSLFSCFQKQQPQDKSGSESPPKPIDAPQSSTVPDPNLKPVVARVRMNGLTFVAPPKPFPSNPMIEVKGSGANWISVIPYAYTRLHVPTVKYSEEKGWQWWGESPEGTSETIRLAHEKGIKVMLKPQVYVPYGWTGTLDFPDADWPKWEAEYERYIMRFAKLADSLNVEMFCIGTEFNNAIQKRPDYWKGLIQRIKQQYKGKLTYSSNWDDWDRFPFWAELDYIGLGGYFPLVDAVTPAVEDLKTAWQPIKDRLKAFSTQQQKPVLFTEFGYLSVDGCGWRNWELEKGIEQRKINEQAQSNCYEALFSVFHTEPWWGGCFLWKWFPNMQGHEGYPERDYTPQGKLGEKTLGIWYRN